MTAQDLIRASLRLIGAIATGETPSASELSDAKEALNGLLESWSTQNLAVSKYSREIFTLIPSQSRYTVGPLADFDTTRPVKVIGLNSLDSDVETPIEILNIQQYAELQSKTSTNNLVSKAYIEGDAPLEAINFYPVPSDAKDVVMYSQKLITEIDDVTDELGLPPGYERALKYNLAVDLAPEFGRPINQTVFNIAEKSLANIKRRNTKPLYLKSDALGLATKKSCNIFSGE